VFALALLLPFVRKNYLLKIIVPLLALLVSLSLSRIAMLSLISVLGYWLWQEKQLSYLRRIALFALMIAPAVGGLWVLNTWHSEIISIRLMEILDVSLRKELAMMAMRVFMNRLLIGIGAENFAEYLLQSGSFPAGHGVTENLTPHSLWVQVAAEEGILGILALGGWFFILYKALWGSNAFNSDSPWLLGLKLFFIAEIITLSVGYIAGSGRLQLGLFVGLILASLRTFHKIQ
jgi:O-antigen ligase